MATDLSDACLNACSVSEHSGWEHHPAEVKYRRHALITWAGVSSPDLDRTIQPTGHRQARPRARAPPHRMPCQAHGIAAAALSVTTPEPALPGLDLAGPAHLLLVPGPRSAPPAP